MILKKKKKECLRYPNKYKIFFQSSESKLFDFIIFVNFIQKSCSAVFKFTSDIVFITQVQRVLVLPFPAEFTEESNGKKNCIIDF